MRPINRISVRSVLVLVFAGCLALVVISQLLTRYFVELPALYEIEHRNDLIIVNQTYYSLELELYSKELVASDAAHWSAANDLLLQDNSGARLAEYLARESFDYLYTAHAVPQIDGYHYMTLDDKVFFQSVHDHNSLEPIAAPTETLPLLAAQLPDSVGSELSGWAQTEIGPIAFAVTGISNDDASLPSSGYLLVWQKLNDAYWPNLTGDADICFLPVDDEARRRAAEAILLREDGVSPRNEDNRVNWVLEDAFGEPLFLVSQTMPTRSFDEGTISASGLVGLATTVLLLAVYSFVVSKRIIAPLEQISQFVGSITRSEDFSVRLPVARTDEIGVVARYLDRLLDTVQTQEDALKDQNRKLEELADRDALTGIFNRRHFDRELSRSWASAERQKQPISCVLIDVDWFGEFNNTYGHPEGDSALTRIATRLNNCVARATDSVCRYGGEEFVVLLPNTETPGAIRIANSLIEAIEEEAIPYPDSITANVVTASAGVSTLVPSRDNAPELLVIFADKALYRAKKAGRNQVVSSARSTTLVSRA